MTDTFFDRFKVATKFRVTLISESDRGCALMAAAFLDLQLSELIKANLIDHEISSKLLSQNGPLATFSSRIDMAFAQGLIGLNVRRDLDLIRRIRNDFAHDPNPMDFTDQRIESRCREFVHNYKLTSSTPRQLFTGVVMAILSALLVGIAQSERAKSPPDVSMDQSSRDTLQKFLNDLKEMTPSQMVDRTATFAALVEQQLSERKKTT